MMTKDITTPETPIRQITLSGRGLVRVTKTSLFSEN